MTEQSTPKQVSDFRFLCSDALFRKLFIGIFLWPMMFALGAAVKQSVFPAGQVVGTWIFWLSIVGAVLYLAILVPKTWAH